MSQEIINVGASPNDGAGDPIRTAFIKTNTNFTYLFALPNQNPPSTLVGASGDVPGMYAYSTSYFYYCFGTYDGATVIWAKIAQVNDVSVTNINNGTSNVSIRSANANVTISVNGTSNIAVFSNTGLTTNTLSVTGISNFSANITATGNILSNGYVSAIGNIRGANIKANQDVSAFGNILSNGYVSSAGNVRGGNLRTFGQVTATGNVYGNNIIATGVVTSTGTFRLPSYTTAQIANISAVQGDMVYNSDLKNIQAYQANSSGNITWVSFTSTT